jgi:hypothetical protein
LDSLARGGINERGDFLFGLAAGSVAATGTLVVSMAV